MGHTEARNAPRYAFVDALRGIAAMSVVLFHAYKAQHIEQFAAWLPESARFVLEHGNTGVFMFFVISGFVIANTLLPTPLTPKGAGRFVLRRAVRLDPPYWASMACVVLLALLSARMLGKAYTPPDPSTLLLHVLYLPGLAQVELISDVYWTLCLEVQFYVVFALLMLLVSALSPRLSRERALDLVLLPLVAFSNLWALGLAPFDEVPGLFLSHFHLFLTGVLVYRAHAAAPGHSLWPKALAALQVALLLGTAIQHANVALFVGASTACALLVASQAKGLTRWLAVRPLLFLGTISYSLYLVHNPITGAVFRVGYRLTDNASAWVEALWLVVVVAACVLGSYLFYRAFEAPSIALARKLGTQRKETPLPAHEGLELNGRESLA